VKPQLDGAQRNRSDKSCKTLIPFNPPKPPVLTSLSISISSAGDLSNRDALRRFADSTTQQIRDRIKTERELATQAIRSGPNLPSPAAAASSSSSSSSNSRDLGYASVYGGSGVNTWSGNGGRETGSGSSDVLRRLQSSGLFTEAELAVFSPKTPPGKALPMSINGSNGSSTPWNGGAVAPHMNSHFAPRTSNTPTTTTAAAAAFSPQTPFLAEPPKRSLFESTQLQLATPNGGAMKEDFEQLLQDHETLLEELEAQAQRQVKLQETLSQTSSRLEAEESRRNNAELTSERLRQELEARDQKIAELSREIGHLRETTPGSPNHAPHHEMIDTSLHDLVAKGQPPHHSLVKVCMFVEPVFNVARTREAQG